MIALPCFPSLVSTYLPRLTGGVRVTFAVFSDALEGDSELCLPDLEDHAVGDGQGVESGQQELTDGLIASQVV
jgi:hypothetical protein